MSKHKQPQPVTVQEPDASTEELELMKNKYLRALADYQNLEKRMHASLEHARKNERQLIASRFLDLLDALERAEVFVEDTGLSMVLKQFKQILTDLGIEEIELVGTQYDPELAEAIEVVPGEEDNIVTEVVRKGYRIDNDIIRTAQVKVSKNIAVAEVN